MFRRSLLALLVAALVAPAAAEAAPVAGGASKLTFDRGALALLADRGVRVISDPPARVVGRRSIALPVAGGDVAPDTGEGLVSHGGAVILRRGARTLTLAFPRLRIAPGGTLSVRAAGRRVALARVGVGDLRVRRQGVDILLQGLRLELTGAGARLIGRALRIDGLRRGLLLARVSSTLVFGGIVIDGGRTTVTIDPDFLESLEIEGITVTAMEQTELRPEGFVFPIVSGSIGRGTVAGRLLHHGGVRVSDEETRLELERFDLDIDSGTLTVLVGGTPLKLADIDFSGATAEAGAEPRTSVLRGLGLGLSEAAADAFNERFETSDFGARQFVGTVSVVARGR